MQSLALDESDCPQRGRRLARLVSCARATLPLRLKCPCTYAPTRVHQVSPTYRNANSTSAAAHRIPRSVNGAHPNSAGGVRAPPPPDDPEARWRSGVNASLPARRFRESREGHEALKAAAPASRDVPGLGAGVRTKPATPIRPPRYPGAP
ncbi:hypothetical protein B0H15DRAFT_956832 [Mycena belliarum]|uniref:Uncharacterized protein n=1 Tax=Mycena belliarum TaxID=1033014 RepID=A0AAD6TTT8_9AGAR|nr:hypothetical protein B0H15DRAFT_956832 [Mycena belliae]